MALITISSITPNPPIHIGEDADPVLRGFYSQRFLDSDEVTVVMPGDGVSGFYYEIQCSVNEAGNLVVPAFTIRTTDGVDIRTSRFTGQLFVDGAPNVIIFGFPTGPGWVIAGTFGSPVTWDELAIFNQGQVQLTNISAQTTLSADAIIALIEQISEGSSGYSGRSGYSGYSGQTGVSGFSGRSGYSGFSAASGYSGFTGKSGYSGYSGSGFSGYSGFSGGGSSGYSGYSGPSGYSGFTGISGFSGNASGYSGFSGPSGYSGYSGDNPGSSGISGASGYSGYSGRSGYSGYSGSGISGYSGFSGAGVSGYSGYSGPSGYSGFSSISGYSGYSGSGVSGYSGYSGGGGDGDVTGPGSSTDNAIAVWDGATGDAIKNTVVTVAVATGDIDTPGTISTGVGDIGVISLTAGVFADLPGSPSQGAIATITDANTGTWGATVASGGGSTEVLIWFNGTAWTVVGA